jgi:hypothetical protein
MTVKYFLAQAVSKDHIAPFAFCPGLPSANPGRAGFTALMRTAE